MNKRTYAVLMILKITALLLIFCYPVFAQNTTSPAQVKGKVIDAETGKPLPNASVYLNGTYKGTVTDTAGKFSLTATKSNTPLVISHIGFELQLVTNYGDKDIAITLKHKNNLLREVTIGGLNRDKEMRLFLQEFIGSTDKEDCVIINPDDIWFSYDSKKDSLTAGADKPLIIYNKQLGYQITYFLTNFDYKPGETNYSGNYFFTEDTTGLKPAQIKLILWNRNEAYFGSRMHFIRALWANDLKNNKFKIDGPVKKYVDLDDYAAIERGITYENIVGVKNDNRFHDQKYIALKSIVWIHYNDELSAINPKTGYIGTLIDSNGYYGEGLKWSGGIGIERVNKLLPFEFEPVGR